MSDCETQSMPLGNNNQPLKGVTESARRIDLDSDDFTTSSILEFLNQEKQCLDLDNDTEVDVDSIFEEINRLSGDMNGRNVEDILREAEMLISKQELGQLERVASKKSTKCVRKTTAAKTIKSSIPTHTEMVSLFCVRITHVIT